MTKEHKLSEAGEKYASAHTAHYTSNNLLEAIELYGAIMAAHPDTPEAEYSRAQINNIVAKVIPKQELLDTQIQLALTRLKDTETSGD